MTEQQPTEQIKPKVTGKPTGKPFVKGDPRINRKGRPKSFDQLRALAQQISHEILTGGDGSRKTVVEALLRKIATEDPKLFLEIAFGKVPQAVDVTSGGQPLKVILEWESGGDSDG